ncbi:hypothetical protein Tsubulata_040870 [Turnera subulata]|uniref:Uncharacterized protein n=1 Tax=Turnera subulata TaxID=218843 RepID=A0A9Q0IZR0_9ROSI|nr:hypothetical protein Tsubulata_040870 [Turnera subulata]
MSNAELNLRSILDANKLIASNFTHWFRNLKIVLKSEKIAYVLDDPVPPMLKDDVPAFDQMAYLKHTEDSEDATCIILASMSSEL